MTHLPLLSIVQKWIYLAEPDCADLERDRLFLGSDRDRERLLDLDLDRSRVADLDRFDCGDFEADLDRDRDLKITKMLEILLRYILDTVTIF